MFHAPDTHPPSHHLGMTRYLSGEMSAGEGECFRRVASQCPVCRDELPRLGEVADRLRRLPPVQLDGDLPDRVSGVLFDLHRRQWDRAGWLGDPIAARVPPVPAPVKWLAAAVLILALSLPLTRQPDLRPDVPGVAVESAREVAVDAAPPEPATRLSPAPRLAQSPRPAPARATRPPPPSPPPQSGEVPIDARDVVILTQFLSGNLDTLRSGGWGGKGDGPVDAVDLALWLNYSVDNINAEQFLSRRQQLADRRRAMAAG